MPTRGKEAAHFVENFHQRELEVDEQLVKVKELQQHWKDKVTELQQEADKIAAEILKKKDEEIDIDYVRTLVASAMKQQSKCVHFA
ncbi:hypothetical protein QYE76_041180 [Lolium multiflorum]|uniref:Uncharacterized protein n=1 Tax=Lolium multiflorum TaxID=4521 RepID=A0AAD8TEG3_LOLMU|nr:hypothetical protein QYE76_041180 [Lolium multiflorum]